MDELPELPFEKILGYLSMEDLIKSRAVSKRFCAMIDGFRVKSLCCCDWEPDYTDEKHHIVDKFAQNFVIGLSKLTLLVTNFNRTVLSDLKHLRLCDLDVDGKGLQLGAAVNYIKSLERLDFIRVEHLGEFLLILPNLKSIRIDHSDFLFCMLSTPRLSEIRVWYTHPRALIIAHPESVETVAIPRVDCLWPADLMLEPESSKRLEGFKNLRSLHCERFDSLSDTLLSSLEHLKEISLDDNLNHLEQLHDQKRRYGRSELKIYYRHVCLATPSDHPNELNLGELTSEVLNFLFANYSGLADQIPLYSTLNYPVSEIVTKMPVDFWGKLTRMNSITIRGPIENVEQFLDLWRTHQNAVRTLSFRGHQSQEVFNRLSADRLASNIQCLLSDDLSGLDLTFVFKFENLVKLWIEPLDVSFIPEIFKQLKFLRNLTYFCEGTHGMVEVTKSKRFIWINFIEGRDEVTEFNEIDEVVEAIRARVRDFQIMPTNDLIYRRI